MGTQLGFATLLSSWGILILGVVNLACFVYVLTQLADDKGSVHAIIGLFFGIYPYIWGWRNVKRYELQGVMIFWTVCLLLGCGLYTIFEFGILPESGNLDFAP